MRTAVRVALRVVPLQNKAFSPGPGSSGDPGVLVVAGYEWVAARGSTSCHQATARIPCNDPDKQKPQGAATTFLLPRELAVPVRSRGSGDFRGNPEGCVICLNRGVVDDGS